MPRRAELFIIGRRLFTAGDPIDRSGGPEEAAADHVGSRDSRHDVFLSHSSRDKPAVERIARALKESGIEPWFDKWHLTPGGDWQSELAAGLRSSRSCAVFVGEEGLGDWERHELGLALDQAAKDRRFRVFAVLLPGVQEPFDPTSLPPFLSTRTWVDFRGGFNDRRVLQRLINAVVGIPLGAEVQHAPRPEVCPYRGLQTFDEEHADFFFGRDADVQRLLERLKDHRFLAVIGPSGSGKSSLVRAGLLPTIRRGALPGSDTWRVVVLRPGAEPLTTVAAQLLDLFPERAMHSTVDLLASDDRTLHLAAAQGTAMRPHDERIVWVLDQFEEVFTLCHDQAQRRALFANVLHAAFAPGGRNYVVVTMRADFYPKCAAFPELAQAISANQFLAWPMEVWALAQAIEEPARAVGLHLEEGLTDQILTDLQEAPGALPLMEHALLELWERRRGTMLTLEAYRATGGVGGSLAKRADLVYESLREDERAIARRVLLRLTQPGEGTEDTRRRAAFEELVGTSEERDAVERVVGALTHARLLTTGTDPTNQEQVVDVSHEALIRGWPRLREWLDEDRAGLRIHRRLTEASQEWSRSERDPEALYRGVRLAQASEWAERNPGAMNALEVEFLRESGEAQERARRRRQRGVRIAAAALVSGLVVVSVLALLAFRQSQVAKSREIAATAAEQLERDPQLSLILATKAYEKAPTAQAEAAIREALVQSSLRRIIQVGAPGVDVDVTPDGKLFATNTPSGEVALWDLASGRRLKVLEPGKPVGADSAQGFDEGPPLERVSFSPDGKTLFSSGPDGGGIWSVPDGRLVVRLRGAFYSGGWGPDGRTLLTMEPAVFREGPPPEGPSPAKDLLGNPGNIRLRDTTTGKVRAELLVRKTGPFSFGILSPDGRFVAVEDGPAVRVERVSPRRTVRVFDGRGLYLSSPFSADGRLLVVPRDFDNARVYDVASGRLVLNLRPGSGIYDAVLSPDGSRVVTGQIVGSRIWEVRTGRFVELSGHAGAVVRASFSRDGSRVLTVSEDNTARVWDAETGRLLATLAGHSGPIGGASLTRDGRSVVTSSGGEVRVWQVEGGASAVLRGHTAYVVSARFSPDGRSIITSDVGGGTARVWEAGTWRQKAVLRPPAVGGDELLLHSEFSADGRLAVTSGLRLGATDAGGGPLPAILWDLATGKVRTQFRPPDPADPAKPCTQFECTFEDAALSPDGKRLATVGGDGFLRVWDAADATALQAIRLNTKTLGAERVPLLAVGVEWTPDGTKVIALAGDGLLHLFDGTTFRRIREFGVEIAQGSLSALNPELSADGSSVAVGYPDGTARVWETATGRLVAGLPHAGPVYDVGFSPDGDFLITAAGDAPTIWDLESQRPLTQLFGHQAAVISVDFSPSGSLIVSAGEDRTPRIWRCEVCAPIDELLELARERALRDLTPAERDRFF